jgi:hypothetical protein
VEITAVNLSSRMITTLVQFVNDRSRDESIER